MRKIQATEAKAHLADLLRTVERGETVAITRHGKTIAHLVPAHARDSESRQAAVERFRQRRLRWSGIEMTTQEILDARHEGHRS